MGVVAQEINISSDSSINKVKSRIERTLDSLAEVEMTTYVGTDLEGLPDPELAAGDTIIPKQRSESSKLKAPPDERIDINSASKALLITIPGIGKVTADRIIERRNQKPFRSLQDLLEVKNIGNKKLESITAYIKVSVRK